MRSACARDSASAASAATRMPAARTLPALLDEMARRHGDREALVGNGQRYTYAELRRAARRLAKGLHALGIRHGDKVAILAGNRPEWVIADFAITQLGGVMVAVNTWATAREFEYVMRHSDAVLLIMVDRFLKYDYVAYLDEIAPRGERLPLLREVVCLAAETPPGCLAYAALEKLGDGVPDETLDAITVSPEDIAYLLYTSGSTSTPKGVQLQHYALIENMWNIGERMHLTERDRLWLAVSLFWGLGCENALINMMTRGGCVVLQDHFEPGEALDIIERERCTVFYGTPNMAQAMHEHPDRPKRDLSSLRTGGTLGTPEQIARVVELGAREICHIYGLTECYGNSAVTDARDPAEREMGSVGRPLDGVTVRIADLDTGMPLPAGMVGEIRIKGYVTPGYYKDPEKNAIAFDRDGFFATGDLGMVDEGGRLYFRGRVKEMVKTGGINVAPVEVEEILMCHPAVSAAYVVGVPDPVRDEIVAAVIVPRSDRTVSEDELQQHCRRALAAYKVPRLFRFVAERDLPLTVTGKIQKNRLPTLFSTQSG
jgi:fatty-acyl-CoA synthase